jgi:hypothetical protein
MEAPRAPMKLVEKLEWRLTCPLVFKGTLECQGRRIVWIPIVIN